MKIYYEEYMYTHALSSYYLFLLLIVRPHPHPVADSSLF